MGSRVTDRRGTDSVVNQAVPEVILMSITPNGEDVIERACRTCYLSFHRYDPPASTEELIKKVIRKGHHSVLEHASATFRIKGGSRVFTHEMVRHRLMSPSQESQRYVHYGSRKPFEVVLPDSIKQKGYEERYFEIAGECYSLYQKMVDANVPKEDARYILPGGITSEIVVTANFRELRHIFSIRTVERAHWEIRKICLEMLRIMKKEAPIVFWDFEVDEEAGTGYRIEEGN
ncbi:MAG: FAD-dependent thymidylate synthase [candidate division Zixibacteria bacterium]|jgi:thymidylate synthase (FAD)|nr:FAD-dependent thymidylate synthase [candidate division Zixibacteria bacterium]